MNADFGDMLDEFLIIYLDDLLIYSRTYAEHEHHVQQVLQRLRECKWYAKPEKCEFAVNKLEFLGFVVSAQWLQLDPKKVDAVKNWATPTSVGQVREFVGFAQFMRKPVKDFSRIMAPITDLTKGEQAFHW